MNTAYSIQKYLKELKVESTIVGDGNSEFLDISDLGSCKLSSLIFVHSLGSKEKENERLNIVNKKQPSIVITTKEIREKLSGYGCVIEVHNPRLAFSLIAKKLNKGLENEGIDRNCIIYDDFVTIGKLVSIGPFSVIGNVGLSPNKVDRNLDNTAHLGKVEIGFKVSIGSNCHIARAVLGKTIIGNSSIIANNVTIGHGTKLGKRVKVAPGVVISGSCDIGNDTWIGPNVSIKENITIGANCFIGIGSVVLQDVPDDSIAYGNPAKVRKDARQPW
jgi:UDP-3-O-[3-hydroxymyristoyl] glucosamine N-acyltransferase